MGELHLAAVDRNAATRPAVGLDFYPAVGSRDYIGQIRLWKAANAAGAAALQFREVPNSPL